MQEDRRVDRRHITLFDICSDCFALILHLRAAHEFGNADILRQKIKDLFTRIEKESRQNNITSEAIQMVIFALAAFVDETISTSEWSQKQYWLYNMLQMDLFNRSDAGEEFYRRLDLLRQRVRDNAQVLEIYYLCLVLGFKGKYQIREQEKLRILIGDLYAELQRLTGKPSNILSPHGRPKDEIVSVMKNQVPLWVIGAASAAIGLIFYLIMTFLISGSASDVATKIQAIS